MFGFSRLTFSQLVIHQVVSAYSICPSSSLEFDHIVRRVLGIYNYSAAPPYFLTSVFAKTKARPHESIKRNTKIINRQIIKFTRVFIIQYQKTKTKLFLLFFYLNFSKVQTFCISFEIEYLLERPTISRIENSIKPNRV